ncbi:MULTISPECIES: TlyA family RNA methyltransferase [Rhodomicrobium]|uniref:TlyA family RNA methyltransferase n=1 Tax=Rhodomicrobium TaxID=1068 RepID=UPI000B4BDA11|nr:MULTISPECIES: TlyA family RNA methyltransferase [Rhodomicrobium]
MTTSPKTRLDQLLTLRGLAPTRSRARDLIKRGAVLVAGKVETRAGVDLPPDAEIAVNEDWSGYVSRGALKLAAALDAFAFECDGRIALDIGASTGGFAQILLRRGARHVYAVDVGSGQLHPDIAADPRISNLEATDSRRLDAQLVPAPIDAITADVSFIALSKALPTALALAAPGAWLIALVKPQFEAGRENIGKGGIVRSEAAREAALQNVIAFIAAQPGWRVGATIPSPIAGQSGNAEYLLGARYAP